jgi:hypothetical protein
MASNNSSKDSKKDKPNTAKEVEKYVIAISEANFVPASFKPHIVKAAPIIGKVAQKIEDLIPVVQMIYGKLVEVWIFLKPYKVDLLIPSAVGFILCFFGGSFLTLIAAVEAYRMVGYESSVKCFNDLVEDLKKVVDASKKDDEDNANGEKKEVDSKQIVARKTLLFLRTIDPDRVTAAIVGLNSGFLAVLATLKLEFAKAITLGNAIGDLVEKPALKYVHPIVSDALPAEYKRWAQPIIVYTIKTTTISIAFTIQRVISAFHSAMRGGLMCARNVLHYLSEMQIIHINHEESNVDEIAGYALAAVGLLFQLKYGFSLPFPLNVLLFPFSVVEYFLLWMVNAR